jgi:methionyl-tRNA formyltransferase
MLNYTFMKYVIKTSLKVLLTANESAGVQALRLLNGSGHTVAGVVTEVDQPGKTGSETLRKMAEEMGIPIYPAYQVENPSFADKLHEESIDLILNVHLLRIIHPEILKVPSIGAFNLHPGKLPSYSGLNAPSWSIYNREDLHEVTLHHISPKLDAGPIAYRNSFELQPNDTALTVSMKCLQAGAGLILKLLRDAVHNPDQIPEFPQDLSMRRLYKKNEIPNNGVIQWQNGAEEIEAFIRACDYGPFPSPWGYPTTKIDNEQVEILDVSLTGESALDKPGSVRSQNSVVSVACGDEWIQINKCRLHGKTTHPHKIFPHRITLPIVQTVSSMMKL